MSANWSSSSRATTPSRSDRTWSTGAPSASATTSTARVRALQRVEHIELKCSQQNVVATKPLDRGPDRRSWWWFVVGPWSALVGHGVGFLQLRIRGIARFGHGCCPAYGRRMILPKKSLCIILSCASAASASANSESIATRSPRCRTLSQTGPNSSGRYGSDPRISDPRVEQVPERGNRRLVTGGVPAVDESAANTDREERRSKESGAHVVENHVDPGTLGDSPGRSQPHRAVRLLATWSAPSASARSHFSSVPAVASTVAPACLASWMPAVDTPEPAAWIITVSPAWSSPTSNSACAAVRYAVGKVAA